MTDYIFPIFFNEKRELKKDALESLGFKSKIGIEYFSCEELELIYEKFDLGNSLISVHHAQWGHAEEINQFDNFNDACDFISEIFYEDKILFFPKANLYVWEPGGNDFFVLFGDAENIRNSNFSLLDNDYYMEVLDDDTGMSEKGRKYMLNALEMYGGVND